MTSAELRADAQRIEEDVESDCQCLQCQHGNEPKVRAARVSRCLADALDVLECHDRCVYAAKVSNPTTTFAINLPQVTDVVTAIRSIPPPS